MSASAMTGGFQEHTVIIPAGQHDLYGIYAQPVQGDRQPAILLLTGGGHKSMMGRNRTWVRLARRLAAEGFPVLRFDYHGVCESTGTVKEFWLDDPFVEDLEGAVNWLRAQGMSGLILVGECFGARTILAAAEGLPELRAAALLSVPLRDHQWGDGAADRLADRLTVSDYIRRGLSLKVFRRLMDPSKWWRIYRRILTVKAQSMLDSVRPSRERKRHPRELGWVSPLFLGPLRHFVQRGVPLLLLYGVEEDDYIDFRQAMTGELGRLVREGSRTLEIQTVEGVLHALTRVRVQEAAIDATVQWIVGVVGLSRARNVHEETREVAPVGSLASEQ